MISGEGWAVQLRDGSFVRPDSTTAVPVRLFPDAGVALAFAFGLDGILVRVRWTVTTISDSEVSS